MTFDAIVLLSAAKPPSATKLDSEQLRSFAQTGLARGHFTEDKVPDFSNKWGDLSTEALTC